MRQESREQCKGLRTLGAATPEQLARLEPGGDLYAQGFRNQGVVGGNICELGVETVTYLVPNYVDAPATPGGWFLHHAGGGISRVLNPDPAWGTPAAATSLGTVTLTGRKDDRTAPWAFEIDTATATGSLPAEPVAPPQPEDRTSVDVLTPERLAELRAEQAEREAALRAEIEARRAAAAEAGGGAATAPPDAEADAPGGAAVAAGGRGISPLLLLLGGAVVLRGLSR